MISLILWSVIVAVSVILDRVSKYIVVRDLKPIGEKPFIDGFIGFNYTENTGAAFGMMKGMRWVFIVISTAAIILIAVWLVKKRKEIPALLGISLSMVIGGGIGNQIDRIISGFVVDFIEFQFIDFAIFNIADCFVTVGVALAIIDMLFINRKSFDTLFGGKKDD